MEPKTAFHNLFVQFLRLIESITLSSIQMEETFSDIIEIICLNEGLFQSESKSYEITLVRKFLLQFLIVHSDYSLDPDSKWHHIRFHLQHLEFSRRPLIIAASRPVPQQKIAATSEPGPLINHSRTLNHSFENWHGSGGRMEECLFYYSRKIIH